ncbi:hypothetical protein HDU93_006174 [Gonapodya sp. JEL0774]|nr:hypothetical protein HDU93_006174 [Gonapodya sp. JEL0774]
MPVKAVLAQRMRPLEKLENDEEQLVPGHGSEFENASLSLPMNGTLQSTDSDDELVHGSDDAEDDNCVDMDGPSLKKDLLLDTIKPSPSSHFSLPPLAQPFEPPIQEHPALPSPDTSYVLSDTSLFSEDDGLQAPEVSRESRDYQDPATDQNVPEAFNYRRKSTVSTWSLDVNPFSQSQLSEVPLLSQRKQSRVFSFQDGISGDGLSLSARSRTPERGILSRSGKAFDDTNLNMSSRQTLPRPPTPSKRPPTPNPVFPSQLWTAPTTRTPSQVFSSTASMRKAPRSTRQLIFHHLTSTVLHPQLSPRNPDLHARRVRRFLRAPLELERFLWLGLAVCTDAFLWCFTALPVRWCIAVGKIVLWTCGSFAFPQSQRKRFALDTAERADLVKLVLVVSAVAMLLRVDASAVYHSVRAQSVVKLYVIFNVLEVLDKLFQSLGHDILDSLFSSSTLGGGPKPESGDTPSSGSAFDHSRTGEWQGDSDGQAHGGSTVVGFVGLTLLGVVYVFLHSLSLFAATTTLNVAVNSHSNALLTLLLSNQFVEVKGAVWKKMDSDGVWQVACADVVERFQLSIYLLIIASRNYLELSGAGTTSSAPSTAEASWWLSAASLFPFSYDPRDVVDVARSAVGAIAGVQVDQLNPALIPPAIGRAMLSGMTWVVEVVPLVMSWVARVGSSPALHLAVSVSLPTLVVLSSEVLVDWLKHAFVTKFNGIEPEVYSKFVAGLCGELGAGQGQSGGTEARGRDRMGERPLADMRGREKWRVEEEEGGIGAPLPATDASPAVARRIGFVPLPLFCLVLRVAIETLHMVGYLSSSPFELDTDSDYSSDSPVYLDVPVTQPPWRWVPVVLGVWMGLWGTKVLVGVGLMRYAKRKGAKGGQQEQLPEMVNNVYPAPAGKNKG